jgi:hypothetical protein
LVVRRASAHLDLALARAGKVSGTHAVWPGGPAWHVAEYVDSRWQLEEPGALTAAEWSEAIATGEDPRDAGERLGINLQRVEAFIAEHRRIGA